MQRFEMLRKQLRLVSALKTNSTSIRFLSTEKPPNDNVEIKETKSHVDAANELSKENTTQRSDVTLESSNVTPDDKLDAKESDKVVQSSNESDKVEVTSFAKSFEKFARCLESEKPLPFTSLLRQSEFVNLGDPVDKVVIGKIFKVVKDDLYIDFGWKFYCVCPKPLKNEHLYVKNATVLLKIKDLELSTRFIGATVDTTILEADCILLGLVKSPIKRQSNEPASTQAK